jgi:nucleoporin SEH1
MAQVRVVASPLGVDPVCVAYDIPHLRMAVFDQQGTISVHHREVEGRHWSPAVSWPAGGLQITKLCWAAPEYGRVLAGAATSGAVCIWTEDPKGGWKETQRLVHSSLPVQDLEFGPRQNGLSLAVAYVDGYVR